MPRYVMIGAPLSHVRTPRLLEARLQAMGLAAVVETHHLEPEDLAAYISQVGSDDAVDGLLVTMPHKAAILAHLAGCTTVARRVGSVNTVKRVAGTGLIGAQFDGVALVRALEQQGVTIAGRRIALIGTGGAGTAIAHEIARQAPAHLDLLDAEPRRADNIARLVAEWTGADFARRCEQLEGPYDIVVNATPLGMHDDDPSPVSRTIIDSQTAVADIVADPPRTRLAAFAKDAGARLITGRQMVEAQIEAIANWLVCESTEQ